LAVVAWWYLQFVVAVWIIYLVGLSALLAFCVWRAWSSSTVWTPGPVGDVDIQALPDRSIEVVAWVLFVVWFFSLSMGVVAVEAARLRGRLKPDPEKQSLLA
jgi:hypothetical protein